MGAGDLDGRIAIWELVSPITGGPEQIRLWVETLTGMELDETGTVRYLSGEEIRLRLGQLDAAGGVPRTLPRE
jgi:hypothetical protein